MLIAQVPDDLGIVDGFSIKYKHIVDMRYQRYGPEQYRLVPYQAVQAGPQVYTIGGLMSYEYYHICVAAMSGGHQSDCSNSLKLLTGESGIMIVAC